jgi:uncharacterized protein (TIGR03000 family)
MMRFKVLALTLLTWLLCAGESQAQRFFAYTIPGDPLLNYSPYGGYYPSYGGYNPSYGGYNPSYGGYYPSYGGYNPSYGNYYPSGGYYSPGASYYPSSMSALYYSQTNYFVLPPANTSASTATRSPNEKAAIEVRVPVNAQVWFDGKQTTQKGSERYFATPPLALGKSYTYEVRATWKNSDGNPITQTREITVEPGKWSIVNFMDSGAP